MKKLFLVTILLSLVISVNAQDTTKTTIKNIRFVTIEEGTTKTKQAIYNGNTYSIQGSITNYKRQIKYFGDCRVLIVANKIIIL